MRIKIDGEICEVTETSDYGWPMITLDGGEEYYLFENAEAAGVEARKYWEDMAESDPSEFAFIVGEKNLVSWALGQYAGPGSTKISSLEEWLDLSLDAPEEQWASYNGEECVVDVCGRILSEELGFVPTVAYRHN